MIRCVKRDGYYTVSISSQCYPPEDKMGGREGERKGEVRELRRGKVER